MRCHAITSRSLVYLGGHAYDTTAFASTVAPVNHRFVHHIPSALSASLPRAPYPLPPRVDALAPRRRITYAPAAYMLSSAVAGGVARLANTWGMRRDVGVLLSHMLDVVEHGCYTAHPPLATAAHMRVNRFPDEDVAGPVDAWLAAPIPPRTSDPLRVALVCMWVGPLPFYYNYFARTASFSQDQGVLSVHVKWLW